GSDEQWCRAQKLLDSACQIEGFDAEYQAGEGAFYGPKIELSLTDSMGRRWQCGTIQFDFNLPERFDVQYTNEQGEFERPVIMHQAMYGSIERWLGILLEVSQGNLPVWLHPVPVAIASVNESNSQFVRQLAALCLARDMRVLVDISQNSVARKMKRFHKQKVPYILTVGDKEEAEKCVSVKCRKDGVMTHIPLAELADYLADKLVRKQ
ncbi:His/Gly/Thr/Pro-type tRNA ligase C-terminal domain-containing protein, partial [Shewanella sp. SM43]